MLVPVHRESALYIVRVLCVLCVYCPGTPEHALCTAALPRRGSPASHRAVPIFNILHNPASRPSRQLLLDTAKPTGFLAGIPRHGGTE